MRYSKIKTLTSMYVAAKDDIERSISESIKSPDVQAEYKQDLEEITELYQELFNMIKIAEETSKMKN